MGIYIKGMEMPKNCDVCPFHVIETEELLYSCVITGQFPILPHENKRSCECVLIELPSHGRLIDADALTNRVGSYMPIKWTYEYGPVVSLNDIECAPTIIEAEESET